jgi:hypothetical protein
MPEGEGRFLLLGWSAVRQTKKKAARKGCISGAAYSDNRLAGQYKPF